MPRKTSSLKELARHLDRDPEHRKEYRRQTPYHDLLLDVVRRRKELGITQERLAELAGMHQSQISRIENAEHDPRLSTIIKLAEALRMRVDMRLVPIVEIDKTTWETLFTIEPAAGAETIDYQERPAKQAGIELETWNK